MAKKNNNETSSNTMEEVYALLGATGQSSVGSLTNPTGQQLMSENANLIPLQGNRNPVVQGQVLGAQYYDSSAPVYAMPNIASRMRRAETSRNAYNSVQSQLDAYEQAIQNIPYFDDAEGKNRVTYEALVNNARKSIGEIRGNNLEDYVEQAKAIANDITNTWGGSKLMNQYNQVQSGLANIQESKDAFKMGESGGYDPDTAAYATQSLLSGVRGIGVDETTGQLSGGYVPSIDMLNYQPVTENANKMIQGYLADKSIEITPNRDIKILRPIDGLAGFQINETITVPELRNALTKYLQSSIGTGYFEQQGKVSAFKLTQDLIGQTNANPNFNQLGYVRDELRSLEGGYSNTSTDESGRPILNEETGAIANFLLGLNDEELTQAIEKGVLNQLYTAKAIDDAVALPISKYAHTNTALELKDDYTRKKEIDLMYEQKYKELGLEGYYEKKGSGNGDEALVDAYGNIRDSALVVNVEQIGAIVGQTLGKPMTLATIQNNIIEGEKMYLTSKEEFESAKQQGLDPKLVKKLEDKFIMSDKYLQEQRSIETNVNNTLSRVIGNDKLDHWYKLYSDPFKNNSANFKQEALNKEDFKSVVFNYMTDILINDKNPRFNDIELDEYFKGDRKKYGKELAPLPNNMKGVLSDLRKEFKQSDKDLILHPNIPVNYLTVSSITKDKSSNAAAVEAWYSQLKSSFLNSTDTFVTVGSEQNDHTITFKEKMAEDLGIDADELYKLDEFINEGSIQVFPNTTKSHTLGKYSSAQQYTVFVGLNPTSKAYQDLDEDVKNNIAKQGKYSMIVTRPETMASESNRQAMDLFSGLFKEMNVQKLGNYNKENMLHVAQAYGYSNRDIMKNFEDKTFYDLSPGQYREIEMPIDGTKAKFKVGSVESSVNQGLKDKNFTLSRDEPSGRGTEVYAQGPNGLGFYHTGLVSDSMNKRDGKYMRVDFNTTDEIIGLFGANLLEGMMQSSNTPKYAKGGKIEIVPDIREQFGVETVTSPKYESISRILHYKESRGKGYKDKGAIGYGKYQFTGVWADKFKSVTGIALEDSLKDKAGWEAQEKFFNWYAGQVDNDIEKVKNKLSTIISRSLGDVSYNDLFATLHFWGLPNVNKLLSGDYTVNTKIPYKKANGETAYNPSLLSYLTEIRRYR